MKRRLITSIFLALAVAVSSAVVLTGCSSKSYYYASEDGVLVNKGEIPDENASEEESEADESSKEESKTESKADESSEEESKADESSEEESKADESSEERAPRRKARLTRAPRRKARLTRAPRRKARRRHLLPMRIPLPLSSLRSPKTGQALLLQGYLMISRIQ